MNDRLKQPVKPIDHNSIAAARDHQLQLTKPPGSLGRLEWLAETFAGWQACVKPLMEKIGITVFAGDHGVCQQQVSAFPQVVTQQMIINFLEGGAAINVLSDLIDADLVVINMGTVAPLPDIYQNHQYLLTMSIAPGTADFSVEAAMSEAQLQQALTCGYTQGEKCNADLFIGGEMGIGNTTAASAIYAALLELSAEQVVGPGTGIDHEGLQRKQTVVARALSRHENMLYDPYQVLRCLGGLEIAGLVGSYIACAQKGIPILVDGFITTAAALLAVRLNAGVRDWLLFSHQSAEPAHRFALEALSAQPLLDLSMRLGEGSGAAAAVPLIRSALAMHNRMATFSQAGVAARVD